MSRFIKYRYHGRTSTQCCHKDTEPVVRDGLAYSPADMARLTERGMPVNSLNTSSVWCDGEENPSFHVGSERARFADVAELWEQHMILRDKARAANKVKQRKAKQNGN